MRHPLTDRTTGVKESLHWETKRYPRTKYLIHQQSHESDLKARGSQHSLDSEKRTNRNIPDMSSEKKLIFIKQSHLLFTVIPK